MLTKILKSFSVIVIILFSLSIYGWMVKHIEKGDKNFSFITSPIRLISNFPDLIEKSIIEIKTLPKTFIKTPIDFSPINKLDSNLIVLSSFSSSNNNRYIDLINLKNDSVLYRWSVDNPYGEHERIINPLLLAEKNLIYSFNGRALTKIDSLSQIIWKLDTVWSHHAMNLDKDGNIWTCTFDPTHYMNGFYKLNGKSTYFIDNFITKIDVQSGKILYNKSIAAILKENNLSNYILKSDNFGDPIHLNDVEPALTTTPYYEKDDLFLSLRQPSIILHFRPSTGEVIRIIEGPFVSQHDIDFYDEKTIVLFNNNYYTIEKKHTVNPIIKDSTRRTFIKDFYSNIIQYNLENNQFKVIGDSIFEANQIFSYSESLIHFIDPNTYFVEEQNSGLLWIIRDDEVIYKNVFNSQYEGYHHLPNWTRIIEYN